VERPTLVTVLRGRGDDRRRWIMFCTTDPVNEIPRGLRRYGDTVVGPPGDRTWLRIVKAARGARTLLTAYTSQDGRRWVRGGVWVHNRLGDDLRIGLVSMGLTPEDDGDHRATFDHVRVRPLKR
jgi:arabinan endo-1,5-alpha-L-arabinosidase